MTRKDRFADMLEKGSSITPEAEQVEVIPRRLAPVREKRMFGSRVDAGLFDEFEFALLEVKRERRLRRVTKEAGLEALLSLLVVCPPKTGHIGLECLADFPACV